MRNLRAVLPITLFAFVLNVAWASSAHAGRSGPLRIPTGYSTVPNSNEDSLNVIEKKLYGMDVAQADPPVLRGS